MFGIHRTIGVNDVIKFRIAHMGVNLYFVPHDRRAQAETIDRPVEIGLPFGFVQRRAEGRDKVA